MNPHRLPRTVLPSRYDLLLETDLPAATFEGEVCITVQVQEPVCEIVLHAAELHIFEAVLYQDGAEFPARVALDDEAERCHLTFLRPIAAGPATLLVCFAGQLNDKLRGFYRSRYRHPSGEERWLAATQFQATDARRAFPCWDEPDLKAVFSSTLVIDPSLTAISNTRILAESFEADRRVVRFADTILMPTYLVAFVVGDLEAEPAIEVGSTPLRVWAVPGKRALTRFAAEVAAFSLRFFESYYALPYPGDKLDLLAIPDFAAGAMENLGAITFRETALLIDETQATHTERERVADVVAHENAHMWFGDLVTMRWWNGLWLNEAFATFLQMLAVDAWKPDWRRWETFGVSRADALVVDGLQASRPVEFPVEAPSDAEAMFDVLTYEKGASVLRMLEQYLGPDLFRDGVRLYLQRHAYGNTDTSDLWCALSDASGLPIGTIMDGWIFQAGYPLITVRRERDELVLRQQRFTYLPSRPAATPIRWCVPVQLRIEELTTSRVERFVLDGEQHTLPWPTGARAVLVNDGGPGFYRVRYDRALLANLVDRLGALSAIERFNLVNDAWATVLAGLMPLTDYLDLTGRFRGERNRNVWTALLGSLATLARIVDDQDRPPLHLFIRDRLGPAVRALGWLSQDEDDDLTRQMRGDLLRALGTLGDAPDVQQEAALILAGGQADVSVQAAAVVILAHGGDVSRYEEFLGRFRAARTPQEEQRFLLALAAFRPSSLIERTLQLSLDGTVRVQDAPLLLRTLLLGVHSREKAWTFFQTHWDEMARRFPGPGIRRLCEGWLGLTTEPWEQQVRKFVQERKIVLGGRTLEQFLEQLQVSVELRRREGKALHDYLRRGKWGKS
ncbi:MAG: M1 family metallopeptidase [Gemmataceae bacterium]